ncbi:MAG: putative permease [Firmicutes bacterium]|nr:putative permease [Bacillota bacterium]
MDTIIKQLVSLFIISGIGYYCGKKTIIDEKLSNGLAKLLLYVTTPLLVIDSFCFTFSADVTANLSKAFMYGLIIFCVTPVFAKLLLVKVEASKRNILEFALVFSNSGFIGFPVAQSVFGAEGVVYTAIFGIFFNFFIWTYGIMLFSNMGSKKDILKTFMNPGIISAVIGLFIMMFSIQVPEVVLTPIKLVGSMTTPLSMIIIGSLLSRADFKKLTTDMSLYYGTFLKLLVIPLALYVVAVLFKLHSTVINTFILLQALPASAMTTMFAESFNKNKDYAVLMVSLSTIISALTLPFIIKICM